MQEGFGCKDKTIGGLLRIGKGKDNKNKKACEPDALCCQNCLKRLDLCCHCVFVFCVWPVQQFSLRKLISEFMFA